jgi:hypothetical protein
MPSIQHRPRRRRGRHAQPGRCERAGLAHGELGRSSTHHDDTPILGAIPAVDQIAPTTPQCPHGEIEPERRHRAQHERARCVMVKHHVDSALRAPGLVHRDRSIGFCRPPLRLQVLLQGDGIVVLRIVRAVDKRHSAAPSS